MDDLRQIAVFDGRAEADLPLTRLLAQQHAQKGRLAGAVVAQQRDALSARDL